MQRTPDALLLPLKIGRNFIDIILPVKKPPLTKRPVPKDPYSTLFIGAVFAILLTQLVISDILIDSISEKFLWRRNLVSLYNNFRLRLGDRVFPGAVVGKEGWLFFTGDLTLQDYQKISPINDGRLKRLVRILSRMNEEVEQYGGTFLVMIPPDKSTVYPQFMPDEIAVIGEDTSLDRLVSFTQDRGIQILDLRPVLMQASKESPVYYRTDAHWNCDGAFYAYHEMIARLKASYPQIPTYSMEDFTFPITADDISDIAEMLRVNVREEKMVAMPKFKSEHSSLQAGMDSGQKTPSLMIFHDSFYLFCMDDYVKAAFERTISIPYKKVNIEAALERIEEERPDIVVVEFAERFMEEFLAQLSE